jgi:GTP cyclohydrolase I
MDIILDMQEQTGDLHYSQAVDTPLRADAFALSDEEKITGIAHHFGAIMHLMGLDLNDDSLKGTPHRVAKMYIKEIFSGLDPANKPRISVFDNKYQYGKVLIEQDIEFFSACEHHFLPMPGFAHVGYVPKDRVIGLSKINRIVKYFAKRPQVQERLTHQIFQEISQATGSDNVIVFLNASHMCVSMRGTEDKSSSTTTLMYSGQFEETQHRNEFFNLIKTKSHGNR